MKNFLRVVIIAVMVVFSSALIRNVYSQVQKFQEISKTETQAQDLEYKNKVLSEKLEKSKTGVEQEKQARDKLGYQKPGDTLYVVDFKGANQDQNDQPIDKNWRSWFSLLLP